MKRLLKGGRVIDPTNNIDAQLDVLIEDGIVTQVNKNLSAEGVDEVISLNNNHWVCPGLIDMHVHLRVPGQAHKENMTTGSAAALAGGFTAVACMPNTNPVADSPNIIKMVKDIAAKESPISIYPVAAASKGLKGQEMTPVASLLKAGAVAISDDGHCIMNAGLMRRILEYASMFNVPFLCHAEDTCLSHGGSINEGPVATRLGVKGIPNASESVIVARDIELSQLTGGHVHFCHLSAQESLPYIALAKQKGLKITSEVAPHHFALTDEFADEHYNGNAKMNPPLRREKDRLAMIEGLKNGTIDAIATDHAPHHHSEKEKHYGDCAFGVIGLETAVGVSLNTLYHQTQALTPLQLVKALSTAPCQILNIAGSSINEQQQANITIIDSALSWTVNPNEFKSLARNTNFSGQQLKGKAVGVILGNKLLLNQVPLGQRVN